MRLTTGKYILFLNTRDLLIVDLTSIRDLLCQDFTFIYGKSNVHTEEGEFLYSSGYALQSLQEFMIKMPICHQSILYNREKIEPYDLTYKIIADRVLTYGLVKKHGLHRQFLFLIG